MLANSKLRDTGVLILLMLSRKAHRPLKKMFQRKAVAHYCVNSIEIIRRFEAHDPIVMNDMKEGS